MQENNTYVLNFGPHHPSTHGVLRLILKMSGEEVISCNPEIGYLHRGVEKICESKKFLSIIPYVDRLDYLAPLICEHAYVLAIEKANQIIPSKRALFIRTIFDELTRISSHIMGIGSATYDIGCLSLFLYGFEEREKIMDIFEAVTGARMHLSYYVPGGVLKDILNENIEQIESFVNGLDFYLDATEKLALNNRIFIKRTKGIGYISKDLAIKSGISGVNLRASGINYDVRNTGQYGAYRFIEFSPITLEEGDSYARNKLRFMEIKQSVSIIKECIKSIPRGEYCSYGYFSKDAPSGTLYEILHNEFFKEGLKLPPKSRIYASTESPRGEFGVHILTTKSLPMPYRIHFKSPSLNIVQLLKRLLIGCSIADITIILGSLDFIMGDSDR
ncbi:MAG: NADH-quinone oxidoreductase subunit D [Holosporales bacterium]|jgi:NADH-quinone oxidoreductase subunit D|nr:NADH-quinone oxidoreductase subunit D [Holosporales bacterium]